MTLGKVDMKPVWYSISELASFIELSEATIRKYLKDFYIDPKHVKKTVADDGKCVTKLLHPNWAFDVNQYIATDVPNCKLYDPHLDRFANPRKIYTDLDDFENCKQAKSYYRKRKEELYIEKLELANLKKRTEIKISLGELVFIKDIAIEMQNLITNFKQAFDVLPFKVADKLAGDYDLILDTVQEEVDKAYEEMLRLFDLKEESYT
jgi:hypothetical protein